jgi:hypothetical protein
MSGGHFNSNSYIYYRVYEFADELENEIQNNDKPDDYGYAPNYGKEVTEFLKTKIEEIRRLAKLMKEIDYLYSGDHGEDTFMKVVANQNDS